MPSILLEYRIRVRNAADTADLLVVSSVRGDTLPYLQAPPTGDGSSLDPPTGKVQSGVYSGRIIDAITSGTSRVISSIYNDSGGRPQLGYLKGYWEFRENGGSWLTLAAGLLTKLTPASDVEWDVEVSEAMMLEHRATSFAPKIALVTCTSNAAIAATSVAVAALPFLITSGTTLAFAGFKTAALTADAAAGATSLTVSALGTAINSGESATATEPISAFLTRWPNRGCLAGGPVRGGFLKQADLGGWEMQVAESQAGLRWLKFLAGYGPPTFGRTLNPKDVVPAVVDAADKFYRGFGATLVGTTQFRTIDETRRARPWGSLIIEIVGVGFFQPAQLARFNGLDVGKDERYRQIAKADIKPGFFINAPGISTGSTVYRVRLFSIEVSEQSPIYWTGHPVDYMTTLWSEQGFSYDASAVTTVRNALGAHRRLSVRKTATVEMGMELEQTCYGPLGIGVRMNSAGQLQPFVSRIFASAAPSIVLTDADVVQGTTKLGALDTAMAIRRVIVSHKRLVTAQDANSSRFDASGALDGFVEQDETVRQENGDPFAVSQNEQTYTIPGMLHLLDQDPDLPAFSAQLAKELFDRRGRGSVKGATTALRNGSGDPLNIGDELLVAVKQLPNKNKRYVDDNTVGPRRMQVVRVTPTTIGKEIELEDSGANAGAVATLPTLSIAASSDLPRTVAELTVTNAATLNALNIGVRIRVATVPSSSPALADYADFVAYLAGQIPTGVIRIAQTKAGNIVFATARTEQIGAQPSAYITAVSVTLTAMSAPTAVTVTPSGSDGSLATVAWTTGSGMTDALTDVFVRAQGDPVANAVRRQILEAGAVQYVLEHLTPGALYTASVQHRDKLTSDVSTLVDVNFTAGATTTTLPVPLYPQGFVGTMSGFHGLPKIDGVYGCAVWATAFPSFVEFFEALETGVGAGTYGSFVSVGRVASVQGDWTRYTHVAPNDKLRRQIQAQHVREGATASTFTYPVTVAPWGTTVPRPKLSPGTRVGGQGRSVVQMLTYEIPNAEFDIWESANQPHAWTVDTGDSSSCAQDQATVFSGDSSAKFSFGAGGSAGTFRGLTTNEVTAGAFCIPLHAGTRYRFKFVSRVSSIANAPSYRVTLTHDVGGTLVTQQTYTYRAANKWQIDLLTFTVPLGAGPLTKLAIEYTRNSTTATDFWQDGTRLQDIGTQRCVILTTGTSWTVPGDFNAANNTVELWGGGGGGAPGTTNANGGGGGGGGGYRYQKNFDPGASTTVAYAIGGGGAASTAGGDTTWNATVTAKGGTGATAATSGPGGAIGSGGTGGVLGGNGGTGRSGTGNSGGGGGGGAAGSTGANNGANGTNLVAGAGGQGGTGVQSNASAVGGTGGVATGGAGGNASQLTSTDDATTAGAGGGGGGAFNPTSGGNGGQYGAGGGGGGATAAAAGSGSSGKQGVIVISWVTAA